jgi:hypothetical protein
MTFIKGQPRPPNGGRRAGTPNRATERARFLISEADDKAIVDRLVEEARAGNIAAMGLYFRYLRAPRPSPSPEATFTPTPFELHPLTTLQEANVETPRIASAVATGTLDHGTGQFLIASLKVFVETLTGVKTEREIAAADALKPGGKP